MSAVAGALTSPSWRVLQGDAVERLRELPDESVNCCVTSPPYFGVRDYEVDGQLGLEATPAAYVAALVAVFAEVRRVLRSDGTLWVILGDFYNNRTVIRPSSHQAGLGFDSQHLRLRWSDHVANGRVRRTIRDGDLKEKDLLGVPWRVAFALRAAAWYLRRDVIWHKPNAMTENVRDRPKGAHEYAFLFSKRGRYFWSERGYGSVWSIDVQPFAGEHFATFPPDLAERCVLSSCPEGGAVLDPFAGAGTTGLVALRSGRSFIGIDLKPEYVQLARTRLLADPPGLNGPVPSGRSGDG